MFFQLALTLILAASSGARADSTAVLGPEETQAVSVTASALQEVLAAPGTQVERVSEEEARARAAAQGIELPGAESRRHRPPVDWDHPWFIVKAGIGLPGTVGTQVEVYVHPNWTVEGGVGTGLLGHTFMAAVHWRPDATCWGCRGKNMFSIGFGAEAHGVVTGSDTGAALLIGSADAMYIHRFAHHFGWVIGLKLGAGATADIRVPEGVMPVEPALAFFLYTGFSF